MKIGFVGLGRMGYNMVMRLLQGEHEIVVYNRSPEKVQEIAKAGAIASNSLEDLVSQLPSPKIVWLMLPAGDVTESYLDQLIPLLSPGDLVVDGANSFYKDAIRRGEKLAAHQIDFLDVGVSGGIWGLKVGYCMMAGGPRKRYDELKPILDTLAPPEGHNHFGPHGAGHFVKMVHNGIEYAMLQAYAEGFEILKEKKEYDLDLEKAAHLWNQGSVIRSWLLELAERALDKEGGDLAAIKGYIEDSGEGRWTVAAAIEENVPAPTITQALFERFRSRQDDSFANKMIAALRNEFGGHAVKTAAKNSKFE